MNIAVVGVTGMVGRTMLKVLEEQNISVDELIPVASENSAGQSITFSGKVWTVCTIEEALKHKIDIALFSAGGDISKKYAHDFVKIGAYVIDNSSAFRMDKDVPLIVPEVNITSLQPKDKIIANPNCSTIQLVVALHDLHKKFVIDRLIISTYQSMTGTGKKAVQQYENEKDGISGDMAYPHPIYMNCIPHCDIFLENGYTKEEMKLVKETHKILNDPNLRITATAVRVPVLGGHSESVNISFKNDIKLSEVMDTLSAASGLIVIDDPNNNLYPMPLYAHNKDAVFVGRVRLDESNPRTINMWIVADNLRKGAATNAVQIAAYLIENNWC